jgi:hypothetical protein
MQTVKTADRDAVVDRGRRHAEVEQLPACDHAVLSPRQRPDG